MNDGAVIADSEDVVLLHEPGRYPVAYFPLAAIRCTKCSLVTLSVVVDPEIMFKDYLYSSTASAPASR